MAFRSRCQGQEEGESVGQAPRQGRVQRLCPVRRQQDESVVELDQREEGVDRRVVVPTGAPLAAGHQERVGFVEEQDCRGSNEYSATSRMRTSSTGSCID